VSDTESEFLELFRDEANERLDNMVDNLLALESGRAEPDALDALFRDAHTIKGGAGMLGLDDVRTLAHAVEDVLGSVREAGVFPPELADPLLRAADALRKHVAGDGEGTPDLLDELAASVASVTGGEAPAASHTARRFSRQRRACSAAVAPTNSLVRGSSGICPEQNSRPPTDRRSASTAWL